MSVSRLLATSAALCFATTPAFAQGQSQSDEEGQSQPQDENVILVTGRAQQLYRIDDTATAKLPADPLDIPISITSINEQLIEDQGARDAQDIYRNISGVTLFSYAGVTARGFRQEEIFFDGLRGDPYVGFNVPQLFNIERVDYLKGPAGMLYGPGAPGGLFNYVTKKPEEEFSGELRAIAGNFDRFGASGEVTGSVTDGVYGRLGAFYEQQDNFRFNADVATLILDAGLTFDMDWADLTVQATYYDQDQGGNRLRGVPVDDDGNFLVTRKWNHNEESDFLDLESLNFQAILEGDITDNLTWNATFRYTDAEQVQQYHEPRALIDIEEVTTGIGDGVIDLVGREFRDQTRAEEQYTFGANAIWSTDLGPVENRLLGGFEYFDGTLDFTSGRANFSADFVERFLNGTSLPSDIIPLTLSDDPNYGLTDPSQYNVAFTGSVTDTRREGLYLLNEATIGPVILSAGVRFDWFSNGDLDESDETFRFGAIYKPREDISIFVQWADSFVPQTAGAQTPETGGPFAPVTGEIIEAGIKTALDDGRIRASLAVYEIKRQNFLQLLVDENGDSIDVGNDGVEDFGAIGEVTSRGIEFDLVADVTDNWVLTLAYAYNDTKITEDNGLGNFANRVGERFANAPEHQLGMWTRYQVPAINTAFAVGADYIDERLSLSGQTVQDYVIFDASIIWNPGPVEVLLRVDNIFDKVYAESGFLERTGHFPGAPRTVFAELIKRF
ncbi:MAG: TonB-dependent siderophore receptor [Pseudomonadota bacterium]